MYVSDYMYAAPQDKWTLVGYNSSDASKDYRAATSVNWMYMGLYEWTISRIADNSRYAFRVNYTGYVNTYYVGNDAYGVRPVFNLSSSVNYVSGSGTAADPILVNWLTDSFEKTSVKSNKKDVKSSISVERFTSFFEL